MASRGRIRGWTTRQNGSGSRGGDGEAPASLVPSTPFTDNRDGGNEVGRGLEDLFRIPGLSASRIAAAASTPITSCSPSTGVAPTGGAGGDSSIALVGSPRHGVPTGDRSRVTAATGTSRGLGVPDMKRARRRRLRPEGPRVAATLPAALKVVIVAGRGDGLAGGPGHHSPEAVSGRNALVSRRTQAISSSRRKGTGSVQITAHGRRRMAKCPQVGRRVNAIWALLRPSIACGSSPTTGVARSMSVAHWRNEQEYCPRSRGGARRLSILRRAPMARPSWALSAPPPPASARRAFKAPRSISRRGIARLPLERTDERGAHECRFRGRSRIGPVRGRGGSSEEEPWTRARRLRSELNTDRRSGAWSRVSHPRRRSKSRRTLLQKAEALARFYRARGLSRRRRFAVSSISRSAVGS